MKKLIAVLSIFLLVLFLGCIQNQQPKHVFVGKNCGTNMTCYQEALHNCEKANVSISQSINGMSITLYSDIQGGNTTACKIYDQIKSIQLPENTSSMEKMTIQMLNGADGTCIGPVNKLKTGSFQEFQENFNCTGTLFDLMKTVAPQTNNSAQGRRTVNSK